MFFNNHICRNLFGISYNVFVDLIERYFSIFECTHMKPSQQIHVMSCLKNMANITCHRWIPIIKASYVKLWCFLWSVSEYTGRAGGLRRHRAQSDVIVILAVRPRHLISPANQLFQSLLKWTTKEPSKLCITVPFVCGDPLGNQQFFFTTGQWEFLTSFWCDSQPNRRKWGEWGFWNIDIIYRRRNWSVLIDWTYY